MVGIWDSLKPTIDTMEFENVNRLASFGFVGGVRVSDLQKSCSKIPDCPGVYLVVRERRSIPKFIAQGFGGHFKGRNPNVSLTALARRWVPRSKVIYIGKTDISLRGRVGTYVRFGVGQACAHWGGRYIWQLCDSAQLLVYWKLVDDKKPATIERAMLLEFKERYMCLPLANLRR